MRFSYKVKSWYKSDPVKAFFTLSTTVIHIIFLLIIVFSPSISPKKKEHKITVKTLYAPKPEVKVIQKPAAAPKPSKLPNTGKNVVKDTPPIVAKPNKEAIKNEKTVPPIVKKNAEKTSPKRPVEKVKENPAAAKQRPKDEPIPQNLLDELEQKINKLQSAKTSSQAGTSSKSTEKIMLPAKIDISERSSEENIEESQNYLEMLITFFHQHLHLPDFGEVKMQITVDKTGKIEKCIVLSAESEKNKKYLQKNLPMLRIPSLSLKEKDSWEQTFILTFCNEP